MIGCKTKEKVTETKVDLQQQSWQFGKSLLQLNETITLFDIEISDSDTIPTPKKMLQRRVNVQQDDTTQNVYVLDFKKKVRSDEHKVSPPTNVLGVFFIGIISVILLLILVYKKFWS